MAGPPTAGLHGCHAILSRLSVNKSVLAPARADASAASHPACPAPTTMTSYVESSSTLDGDARTRGDTDDDDDDDDDGRRETWRLLRRPAESEDVDACADARTRADAADMDNDGERTVSCERSTIAVRAADARRCER